MSTAPPRGPDGAAGEELPVTSGRVTGWLVVGLAAAVAGLVGVEDSPGSPVVAGAALAAVLAWAAMLRPGLAVRDGHLVLRNMLETVSIPLVAIEQLVVRQVLAVRAGGRRYVSTAVGRSLRKVVTGPRPARGSSHGDERRVQVLSEADLVEERVHRLMEDARAVAGIRPGSDEQQALADGVRREPAWVPIALVLVAAGWLVLALLR